MRRPEPITPEMAEALRHIALLRATLVAERMSAKNAEIQAIVASVIEDLKRAEALVEEDKR